MIILHLAECCTYFSPEWFEEPDSGHLFENNIVLAFIPVIQEFGREIKVKVAERKSYYSEPGLELNFLVQV